MIVKISYHKDEEIRVYDYVILTTGFSPFRLLEKLLTPQAKDFLIKSADLKNFAREEVEESIDENLALGTGVPCLHLPMLASLSQGPGFANLSCLGRLSDHILSRYISLQ